MDYSPVCRILGFVVQFTYLQAFFWMNVLSFDIYKAFSKVKLLKQGARADEIRKLLFYTMYACGAPMLIIILSGKFTFIFTIWFVIIFLVFLFSSGSGIPTKYLFRSKTWIWQTKMLFWQWFGQFHLLSSTSFGHSGKVIILVLNYILDFKTSESLMCKIFAKDFFAKCYH